MAARRRQRIAVIGRGRVGRSLARAWKQQGHTVSLLPHDAQRTPQIDIALLSVPDRAIAETALHWAKRLPPQTLVLHTAGALDLSPLEAARSAGHRVGSLHPLLAIPGPKTPLAHASCALDGSRQDLPLLGQLARDAGMRPFTRGPRDRVRYHLGAALAANGQPPLLEAATAQLVAAGIPEREARGALAHLARSALDAWEARGGPEGLTGPVARGDAATVQRHLNALSAGTTRDLYLALSRAALGLASLRHPVPSGLAALRRLLRRG